MNIKQFLIDNNEQESFNFYTIEKLCSYRGDDIRTEMSNLIKIIAIDDCTITRYKSNVTERYETAKRYMNNNDMKTFYEIIDEIAIENIIILNATKRIEHEINTWIKIGIAYGNSTHKKELTISILRLKKERDNICMIINTEIDYYHKLLGIIH